MAARGSFQKRQKEAARREKRQLKLDRRQGRRHPGETDSNPSNVESSTELESESPLPEAHEAETPLIAPDNRT